MKREEIEIQVWEYIDGSCNDADRERIAVLIRDDAEWKQVFAELSAFDALSGKMELEQPSMRFTKDVMDTIAKTHIAPATKQYINKRVIAAIAALFIGMLVIMLGYAFYSAAGISGHTGDGSFSFHFDDVFNSTFIYVFAGVNILLGLVMVDSLLRKRRQNSLP